ncbi:MAG TPA: TIGR03435 family protein [Bryobacteraceae bacterium]
MRQKELLALGIFDSRSRLGDRLELLLRRGRTFSPRVSGSRMALTVAALLGFLIGSSLTPRLLAFAQQSSFDAVSIKPNDRSPGGGGKAGPPGGILRYRPGSVAGTASAKRIVQEAYRLTDSQISGGPAWTDDDQFDIDGKAATAADKAGLQGMLQTMLAERFKLTVRHETKEMPVYVLTVAKNGPKLIDATPGDESPIRITAAQGAGKEGLAGYFSTRASIQDLAAFLSRGPLVDRPVLDKTGLQGFFLFAMAIRADEDFLTQLGDQFGLRFEAQKAPVDTLIIDHIEKPDPN